jgi:hypothetical protein
MKRNGARKVLVGGGKLLDLDQVGVARTAIAHAGGVDFRRLAHTKGKGAVRVRRPGAVIVADDALGLAVAESDLVDGHGGTPFEGGRPFRSDNDKAGIPLAGLSHSFVESYTNR